MKRGAVDHPKILKLAHLLGCSKLEAIGIVESLLHWTFKYAIMGDVGKWDDEQIASGIDYIGDAKKLIESLHNAGFLDPIEGDSRYGVHDIHEHADNAWRQCLDEKGLTFWNGTPPRRRRGVEENWNPDTRNSQGDTRNFQEDSTTLPSLPFPSPTKKRSLQYSDDDLLLAKKISEAVNLVHPPLKEVNLQVWANEIRLMRECDNLKLEEIWDLFSWANKHHFWKANILCVRTLRKQWQKLQAQRKSAIEEVKKDDPYANIKKFS